ncbi:MAG: putative MATE family efflux protein [Crocinitomicaceae bacterium]|jgi:putative MATE family efflux protein
MANDLTQGPVSTWLYKLTGPMVIGILAIFLFNLVDTYFVSLLGTKPLAALSFTFPATMMVMNLAIGLSIATGAVVARSIGQNNEDQTRNWVSSSFYLSIFVAIIFASIGFFTQEWVFTNMGAEPELIPLIKDYLNYWYPGSILLVVMITVNACVRATGNTKLPSIVMLVSALINGILDPIFIFGWGPIPAMGIKGAALATCISWLIGFVIMMRALINMDLIRFTLPHGILSAWNSLIKLGIPAALTNMLGPLANGIIVVWVATYGTHAVAAYGVGSRLEPLAVIIIMALTASLPPFVGQNFGAGKIDRIEDALKRSIYFLIAWQFAVYILLVLLAQPISRLFSEDLEVQVIIQTFLYILPLSYIGLGICLVTTSTINALHKPKYSLLITMVRLFALYIPLAWSGHMLFGLNGIFWGCALGNGLIGTYLLVMFYRIKKEPALRNKLISS